MIIFSGMPKAIQIINNVAVLATLNRGREMGILRISLFGTIRVTHDDWSSETRISPKVQTLLAYLLLQGPRAHSREILADLLWSERTPNQARSCLSTTLWRLRQVLEPESVRQGTYLLTPTTDEISFNWDSNHWLDVVVFEEQIEQILAKPVAAILSKDVRILKEVLQLYTGDLLESLYDDWAIQAQERLRCLYLDCLEHLMRYYKHHGLYAESLVYGQQILDREPLREEIHREIMRLYLENGQRVLAVQQYEICRQILDQELDLTPMKETDLVYAQARGVVPQLQTDMFQQQALEQLGLAVHRLNKAQQQLKTATEQFEYSQQLLHQVLKNLERSASPRSSKHH